jgi:hypothetical protein
LSARHPKTALGSVPAPILAEMEKSAGAAAAEVIPYRPLEVDGRNGLRLSGGVIEAYLNGELKGSAPVPADAGELQVLLAGYRVPVLLPSLWFCFDERPREVEVELNIDFSLGSSAFGAIIIDGERELWEANRTGSNELADPALVPAGARPWAVEPIPGYGWQISLPASARSSADPVFRRRVALAIEAFLYALSSGKEIQVPYRRRFGTAFSAADPMWAANVPVVDEGLPL